MKATSRAMIIAAIIALPALAHSASAQDSQASKLEIGAQFSSFTMPSPETLNEGATIGDLQTEAGFGGRITFNLTEHLALEAEGNFFPHNRRQFMNGRSGGRILQGQFGAKVGRRFNRFGIFGKARPGVMSFSQTVQIDGFETVTFGEIQVQFPRISLERRTFFSFDLGGVLEFYPSRRIVARFDAGDTLIRFGSITLPPNVFPGGEPFQVPVETTHNFQFSAGVGFRF